MNVRMSHARSCAMLVGQKWGVRRSVILRIVQQRCGVDLLVPGTDGDLDSALPVLVDLKDGGLTPGAPPRA
jgi:hypothetical protein